MKWSGESGHACEDQQHKHPYVVDGRLLRLNFRRPVYELTLQQTSGGTIYGSPTAGKTDTQFTLSAVPNALHKFSAYTVTGTTLTGNNGKFNNSDVTAAGKFYYSPTFVPDGIVPNATAVFGKTLPSGVNQKPSGTLPSARTDYYGSYCAQPGEKIFMMPMGPQTNTAACFEIYSGGPIGLKNYGLTTGHPYYGGSKGVGLEIGYHTENGVIRGIYPDNSSTASAYNGSSYANSTCKWTAWYGNDTAGHELVGTGSIPYSSISANHYYANDYYRRRFCGVSPFSSNYLGIQRDKYFTMVFDKYVEFTQGWTVDYNPYSAGMVKNDVYSGHLV